MQDGRATRASSPISDTTWRAPVCSTVSSSRAREQTWIIAEKYCFRSLYRNWDGEIHTRFCDGARMIHAVSALRQPSLGARPCHTSRAVQRERAHGARSWRSLMGQPVESLKIARLRGLRRPRLEKIALHGGGKFRWLAEEPASLGTIEAGESGRFEKRRLPVCGLDLRLDRRRCRGGEPETQMNGGEKPPLDPLVGVADHRFEWRDHIADDVFGRVMKKYCEQAPICESRRAGAG